MLEALPQLLQLLEQARQSRQRVSYRQLLDELKFPAPQMRRLTACLEQLSAYDSQQGWPLRATLVISQTPPYLPRQGFFQHLASLGLAVSSDTEQCQQWHSSEVERVFAFNYPEELPWAGGH